MDPRSDRDISRGLATASEVAAVALLALLIAGRIFYRSLGLPRDFGWDRMLVIALAIGLLVVSRRAPKWHPGHALAAFVFLTASCIALMALPAFGVDISDVIRQGLIRMVSRPHPPARIYRLDDRYGYVHAPNAQDFERTADYSVTYTIDAAGDRIMPAPAGPAPPPVIFLGDSLTFGQGVENDQTYLHLLASGSWRNVRLVNKAVAGWGLAQMYLRLLDVLQAGPVPRAVVSAIIANDLRRSHLRPPLIAGLRRRLEFIDGRFVPTDLVYGATAAETSDLLEREAQLGEDLLLRMDRTSRDKNVAFAVVLLHPDAFPPRLTHALGQAGVQMLDLSRVPLTMFQYDAHPNAADHRLIADAVARSFLTEMVGYGR